MDENQITDALSETDSSGAEENRTHEETSALESNELDQAEDTASGKEEESSEENVPFHKHPRWVERETEHKQQLEELENKIKELEAGRTQPQQQEDSLDLGEFSPQMQKLIKGIAAKVKEETTNEVITSIQARAQEEAQIAEKREREAQKLIDNVKAEVGDEKTFQDSFVPFYKKLYEAANESGESTPGLRTALSIWKAQNEAAPKKDRVSSPSKGGAVQSKGFAVGKGETLDELAERFIQENS